MTFPARPAYQKFEVVARPSAIDGMGVFAAEPVPARRKIGEIRGERMCTPGRSQVLIPERAARRVVQ